MRRLKAARENSQHSILPVLANALSVPLTLLAAMAMIISCHWFLKFTGILSSGPVGFTWAAVQILSVLAVLIFVDRAVGGFIDSYAERSTTVQTSRGIVQVISRGIIISIGVLILLSSMGVSITPIVASLGITSLAIALALQPTLENIFSGMQLVVDKPIRVGDYIELETGEQGFVDKIGWRSTWVKMLQNNTVILPNSVIARSKIINYFYPEKELSVLVDVGVHYSSDLEQVEEVTLQVAKEVMQKHEWGVDDYTPLVFYNSFADSSINFTVIIRVKEYFNQFWVKSAFIKALHKRYSQEGIVIPFPIRAINTEQENAVVPPPFPNT